MKVIDEQILYLEEYTKKALRNINSLHRREKQQKLQFVCNLFSEIYLDLLEKNNGKIDHNTNPEFLRMAAIRDNFYKFTH